MPETIKSIRLTYSEGASDKEYVVLLERAASGGHLVTALYGKRGGNLKHEPKGRDLALGEAEKIFTALVNSKAKKGYVPDKTTDATVLAGIRESEDTGLRAQLLNPIDEADVARLLGDPTFCLEQKFDGERLMVRKSGTAVSFANRKGQRTTVGGALAAAVALLPGEFVIDGEKVQGTFHVFDILERDGMSLAKTFYADRVTMRNTLLEGHIGAVRAVPTFFDTTSKQQQFATIVDNGGEGVVFKRLDALYTPGKPASGGSQVKFKFWKSASCIVAAHNEQSSIALELLQTGRRVPVGNVTVKANQEWPPIGAVVEIKYLYVAAEGGSLYQPELITLRHDIAVDECTIEQIEYRGSGNDG